MLIRESEKNQIFQNKNPGVKSEHSDLTVNPIPGVADMVAVGALGDDNDD